MVKWLAFLVGAAAGCFIVFSVIFKGTNRQSVGALAKTYSNSFETKKYESPVTTIVLTGDIMLGRSVMGTSLAKNDPTYPFLKVAGQLRRADIVFGNLENPIVENCPNTTEGLKFCADPRMVEGLTFAGVDVVSLANNHIRNYGEEGVAQTKHYLERAGIGWVGLGKLTVKEKNGAEFGFLGFEWIDNLPKESDYQLVIEAKKKVDVLIVMVHWGSEYTATPSERQREIAKNLVIAGADAVVGNHPHWTQTVEQVEGKPIFFSLGNFIFDQAWSEETKRGMAVRLYYDKNSLTGFQEMPIYMKEFAQPEWVEM